MRLYTLLALLIAGPACADTCWITPLDGTKADSDNREMQVGNFSTASGAKIDVITVTTVTSTEQSDEMPNGTQLVRFVCDIIVFFAIGTDPTATTGDNYLPANTLDYVGIEAGYRFAVCDSDCS